LSLFLFGVPGLRRTSITIAVLVATSVALLSCGSYNSSSSSSQGSTSGLKFRAFVSNPLRPLSTGGTAPLLEIVDALQDKLPGSVVNLQGANPNPGIMVLSPNKKFTLVISASNNVVTAIDNVARRLGNTRAVSRRSYVHPAVIDSYLDNRLEEALTRRADSLLDGAPAIPSVEAAVLKLIRTSKPRPARRATRIEPAGKS